VVSGLLCLAGIAVAAYETYQETCEAVDENAVIGPFSRGAIVQKAGLGRDPSTG
jgi:hypothetical protein